MLKRRLSAARVAFAAGTSISGGHFYRCSNTAAINFTSPASGDLNWMQQTPDSSRNGIKREFTQDESGFREYSNLRSTGSPISTNTPWVLSLYDHYWYLREDYKAYTEPGKVKVPFLSQPPRHYLGAAWYQRDLQISQNHVGPPHRADARATALGHDSLGR